MFRSEGQEDVPRVAAKPGLELICRMEEVAKTHRHRSGMICGRSDKPISKDLRGAAMQLHMFVGFSQWLWRERKGLLRKYMTARL